jgi:hypothetical protein
LGGRKPSLTPAQVRADSGCPQAAALMKDPGNSAQEVADAASADTFQISLSTLYRYVSPKGEIRQLPKA